MPGPGFPFGLTPAHFFGLDEPLVPEQPVNDLANRIDHPSLDRSPMMARLQGFGAGALQGLRNQTSPANLAGLAANFIPGGGAVAKAAKFAPKAIEGLEAALPAGRALGELMPEFAAVGGEGAYNMGREAVKHAADPLEAVYRNILAKGGR